MELRVRPVRDSDAAAVVALLTPIIERGAWTVMDTPDTEVEQRRYIREIERRGVYFAAVLGPEGEIAGVQSVEPFGTAGKAFAHVGDVSTFVRLDLHGLGIGRRLAETTFAAARKRGFRKLIASIRADNPQAIGYYRRLEFRTIGTARAHARVRGTYLDEILMERPL